jgi:hypothetical protein
MNTISVSKLNDIVRLIGAASKDQIRYSITHVNLRANERREVIAEATNGHALAEKNLGVVDGLSEILPLAFSPDDIKRLSLFLKSLPKLQKLVDFSIEKNQLVLFSSDRPNFFGQKSDFPKTQALWPQGNAEYLEFAFNAETMANLFKAMNDAPKSVKMIKLKIDVKNPKSAPILVSVAESKGLMMPMRF